jgi:hypothetical protein
MKVLILIIFCLPAFSDSEGCSREYLESEREDSLEEYFDCQQDTEIIERNKTEIIMENESARTMEFVEDSGSEELPE